MIKLTFSDNSILVISCGGTENPATWNYNGDGGITKISGPVISSIGQNKSFTVLKYAGGNIYALEYGNGIVQTFNGGVRVKSSQLILIYPGLINILYKRRHENPHFFRR
ncbi:MAG: hypothetical protein ABSG94_01500 [Brevinematales bacterium]|jgi:hypothetical protein